VTGWQAVRETPAKRDMHKLSAEKKRTCAANVTDLMFFLVFDLLLRMYIDVKVVTSSMWTSIIAL
jgi:hypothetical protein